MFKHILINQTNFLSTKPESLLEPLNYQLLTDVRQFEPKTDCIITSSLNPDFSLVFGFIKAIITEAGSTLSHLSILAREYQIPIIRIPNLISKLPSMGKLQIYTSKIIFLTDNEN